MTGKSAARISASAKVVFCLLNLLLFAVVVAKALYVGKGIFHLIIEAGMTCLLKGVSMLLQILTSLSVFRMECFHAHGGTLRSV